MNRPVAWRSGLGFSAAESTRSMASAWRLKILYNMLWWCGICGSIHIHDATVS